MYKLLIVDDEHYIADGLYETFRNMADMELDVYKAYSGKAALNIFDSQRIDIVLSDIHMPGIDGIQLMEEIKSKWPECRVIFLTGYNEFDYIYSAMKHQNVNYLLKSESYDTIIQAVKRDIDDIARHEKDKELLKKAEDRISRAIALMRKEFFIEIIKSINKAEYIVQEELEDLNIPLSAARSIIMLFGKVDDLTGFDAFQKKTKTLFSVELLMERYLSPNFVHSGFTDDSFNIVWLIQPKEDEVGLEEEHKTVTYLEGTLELVQSACFEAIGVSVSFVLDDCFVHWSDIAERYELLKMMLNYRLGTGKGILLTRKSIAENSDYIDKSQPDVKGYTLDLLKMNLETLNKGSFDELFNSLNERLSEIANFDHLPAQELYYSVALMLFSYIKKWNLTDKVNRIISLSKLMLANSHSNWHEAFLFLKKVAEAIFESQASEQNRRTQTVIERLKAHIDKNIENADELTLARLADLVHFNQSYLSRLFKQITGLNLSEYITESRLLKAKNMLVTKNLKIKDIAEKLGFTSAANFGRFFKSHTDVTPQDYRDTHTGS